MEIKSLIIFFIPLLLINIVCSFYVLNREEFERNQKIFQISLIWFIPFFGSILIFSIIRFLHGPIEKNKPLSPSESNDSSYVSSGGGSENS